MFPAVTTPATNREFRKYVPNISELRVSTKFCIEYGENNKSVKRLYRSGNSFNDSKIIQKSGKIIPAATTIKNK